MRWMVLGFWLASVGSAQAQGAATLCPLGQPPQTEECLAQHAAICRAAGQGLVLQAPALVAPGQIAALCAVPSARFAEVALCPSEPVSCAPGSLCECSGGWEAFGSVTACAAYLMLECTRSGGTITLQITPDPDNPTTAASARGDCRLSA